MQANPSLLDFFAKKAHYMREAMMQFGRYEVISEIGRGAMGIVYKAKDPIIDRIVAIKTIQFQGQNKSFESEFRQRFLREAKSAGILHHPNLVTIYDAGDLDGTPYIAMEYVDGESLTSLITRKRNLSAGEATSIIRQVAQGLSYAHRQGIIHRDLKTDNILVESGGRAVIADFGVARLSSSTMTQTGELLGTPAFMSPEQVLGEAVDARSDIFSMGICFYYSLTGKRPFNGDTISSICYHIVHSQPLSIPDSYGIPDSHKQILSKLLSKKKEERYQSCDEFLSRLEASIPTKISTPPPEQMETVFMPTSGLIKEKKGTPSIFLVACLIIFLVAIGLSLLFLLHKFKITKKTEGEVANKIVPVRNNSTEATAAPLVRTSNRVVEAAPSPPPAIPPSFENKIPEKTLPREKPKVEKKIEPVKQSEGLLGNENKKTEGKSNLTGEKATFQDSKKQNKEFVSIIFETRLKAGRLLIRLNDKRELSIPFMANEISEGHPLSRITKKVNLPPGEYNFIIAVISQALRRPITGNYFFTLDPGKEKIFKIEARRLRHDIVIKEIEP